MTTAAIAGRLRTPTTPALAALLVLLAAGVSAVTVAAGPFYVLLAAAGVLAAVPVVWAISTPRRALPLYAFVLPIDVYLSTELRVTTTQLLQVGIVAAWVVRGLLAAPSAAPARPREPAVVPYRLGTLLLVFLIASLAWSINVDASARSVVRNLGAILMAVYAARHVDRPILDRMTRSMCYGALVTALYGVAQFAQGGYDPLYRFFSPFYTDPFQARGGGFSVVATFANPNILAGYLLMIVPLAWASCATARFARRAAWVLAALLLIGVLLLTFSKASWILVGVLAALWLTARLPVGGKLSLLAGAGATFGVALLLLDTVVGTLLALFPDSRQASVDTRLGLWWAALAVFVERPLLGFGLDGFAAATAGVRQGVLVDLIRAHNMYLQTLVDLGLVGSVLWWAPWLLIVRRALGATSGRERGPEATRHLALLLSTAAFALYGLVETLNISNQYVNTSWLVLGLLAASTRLRTGERRAAPA